MLWQLPKNFPLLYANQVHVWRVSLSRQEKELQDFLEILSHEEKERAARFVVKHAADNFIAARGVLRILLAKYLGTKPQDLIFQQNQYGKLYLDSFPVRFNLSHSQSYALFIFALNTPVGIDLEFMRKDYDFADIAKKFFSASEVRELFSLPVEQQLQAFFNCWSRKEAFIKAVGTGMFTSLDRFSVEVSINKSGRMELLTADDDHWTLEALDPADNYAGAFVVGAKEYTVSFYEVGA